MKSILTEVSSLRLYFEDFAIILDHACNLRHNPRHEFVFLVMNLLGNKYYFLRKYESTFEYISKQLFIFLRSTKHHAENMKPVIS